MVVLLFRIIIKEERQEKNALPDGAVKTVSLKNRFVLPGHAGVKGTDTEIVMFYTISCSVFFFQFTRKDLLSFCVFIDGFFVLTGAVFFRASSRRKPYA